MFPSKLVLFFLFVCLTTYQAVASNHSLPHEEKGKLLDFDATNFDAGTLYIGDESYPYFSFVNRTNHNVRIKSLKANNGSWNDPFRSLPIDTNHIIKPGERDTLFFKRYFSYTRSKPGNYDLSWTINFINSNVQQHLNIFCVLKENRGEIELDPIELPLVNIGDSISFSTEFKNSGKDTVTLQIPKDRGFTTYLDKYPIKIAPQESHTLNFEVNTASFPNRYDKYVTLRTNFSKTNLLKIPIHGKVIAPNRPDIYFTSKTLRLDIMEGGRCEYHFWYTNTGDTPLIISTCKGSCGCVVSRCSREPLAPGDSAEVHVKYDSKRVGPINKTITVSSNAVTPRIVLRIKGYVTRKPRTGEVPYKVRPNSSKISFYNDQLFINYKYKEKKKVDFFFTNEGSDSLKISSTLSADGIEVIHPQKAIPPGGKGCITAQYDTERVGLFKRYITVISNGAPYTTILELSGLVRDKNDTLIARPLLTFDRVIIDTSFEYGANAKFKFPFTNNGDAPLIFSCAKSSIPVSDYPRAPIFPGERGIIKVTYDSERVGNFNQLIRLCHNDTSNHTTLRITGFVEPKPLISEKKKKSTIIPMGPEIRFDSTSIVRHYKYGYATQEEFIFTNVGDQPLIIYTTKSSEGIITMPSQTKSVPGKKGIIYATYDTKRTGAFSKTIVVTHNTKKGKTLLRFNGRVNNQRQTISYTEATTSAPSISFNALLIEKDFDHNETVEIEYAFTNKGKMPVKILKVLATDGVVTFPKEPLKQGDRDIILISYPKNKLGPFTRTIAVYHDAANEPIILKFKGVIF